MAIVVLSHTLLDHLSAVGIAAVAVYLVSSVVAGLALAFCRHPVSHPAPRLKPLTSPNQAATVQALVPKRHATDIRRQAIKQRGEQHAHLTEPQIRALAVNLERANAFMLRRDRSPHAQSLANEPVWFSGATPVRVAIHFPRSVLPCLCVDGRYKSRWETHDSGGSLSPSARSAWERELFDGAYEQCSAREKPKYGFLIACENARSRTNNQFGYGDCCLILRPEVFHRCTVNAGDSSVYRLGGAIASASTVSRYINLFPLASVYYHEVQIHGDILLHRDVERIYCPVDLPLPSEMPASVSKKIIRCFWFVDNEGAKAETKPPEKFNMRRLYPFLLRLWKQ